MQHLSTSTSPQSGDPTRRLAVIGFVRKLADGRATTVTITPEGGRSVTTTTGGAR
ncbi:hypothetical protein VSR01_16360 [Actinacidiphila sp. DG2A-62]|uniref:hypothetical protein n=1 Tax=Actinacidiphila sp. DG2A-62 TaxID=3108821 RepID=UPI002DB6842E|nr:hypothetical protein [Actinacidiphila sp. DG2A-62]MEC3995019.1 hypothetical protein [Actinacidiphila sp. DG2A-62]